MPASSVSEVYFAGIRLVVNFVQFTFIQLYNGFMYLSFTLLVLLGQPGIVGFEVAFAKAPPPPPPRASLALNFPG